MAAKDVTDGAFDGEVLGSEIPVVVDFWAPWCGPCKQIAPMIDAVAAGYEGRVRFVKVDVDANPEAAARFGVRSVPTLLLFKGGDCVDRKVGAPGRPDLERWISAHAA